jgi:hypothetical protein
MEPAYNVSVGSAKIKPARKSHQPIGNKEKELGVSGTITGVSPNYQLSNCSNFSPIETGTTVPVSKFNYSIILFATTPEGP